MLYSTILKLDREYTIKIGMRQLTELKNVGIKLEDVGGNDIEALFTIIFICIVDKPDDLTVDKLIDIFDESDMALFELKEVLDKAIELGISKGKKQTDEKKT